MLQFGENRELALVHMVGRVTSREIASQSLDREVEEIIHSEDDQRRARFNRHIEESTVLDLESSLNYDQFFTEASDAVSKPVNVSKEILFELLMEREKESSTALRPDLAIPHIIIDGENSFHILLARCKKGIHFSELAPAVQAVFVLVGTRDQRDYHLFALSAIAEMVQMSQFREKWLNAKNKTTLRNIIKREKATNYGLPNGN